MAAHTNKRLTNQGRLPLRPPALFLNLNVYEMRPSNLVITARHGTAYPRLRARTPHSVHTRIQCQCTTTAQKRDIEPRAVPPAQVTRRRE